MGGGHGAGSMPRLEMDGAPEESDSCGGEDGFPLAGVASAEPEMPILLEKSRCWCIPQSGGWKYSIASRRHRSEQNSTAHRSQETTS